MYTELNVTTHFSFLRGASSCDELFATAALLGHKALGVTDSNSVAGMVRALVAAKATDMRLVPGCRLDLVDGDSLLVWPEDREAWSRLTRLLSLGKGRADAQRGEKGRCFLYWEDVALWSEGLVAALVPDEPDARTEYGLAWMAELFGDRAHLALSYRRRPGDRLRLHQLEALGRSYGVKPLAVGDVLYHSPDRRMLQDVVTAIREKCTIDALGFKRERHADRHLKSVREMERLFAAHPEAIANSAAIAERCTFDLRQLRYQYPDELVMSGRSPQDALERLAHAALRKRFGGSAPAAYKKLLKHELRLVRQMEYAPYFLTVNSIVAYARSQGILCQGRGPKARSTVAGCRVPAPTSMS